MIGRFPLPILPPLSPLTSFRVPDGNSEEENQIVYEWGTEMRKLGESHLWHDEIAKLLGGLLDQEASARLSGSRFYVLIGPLARLERALAQYFLDFHTLQRGYTEVSLPYIVSKSVLQGTGQIPKFEEDLFKVNHQIHNEDSYLIPTAEVPLTNLYRGELLEERSGTSASSSTLPTLPMKLVSCTPCFRAEAGSHGRDTRGLMRVHQFQKVELVKVCKAEDSEKEYDAMCRDVESLLKSLELPHRKALLCSGDTGFSASLCYDYEVWMPGQQAYREVSSCSTCRDFQSRRMKLRHRLPEPVEGKTVSYPHTMNGSGLAVGR
jgi:seryl-tRNA synthetase